MQELVMVTTCDYCFHTREQEGVPAREVLSLADTGEVYVVDLCEGDRTEFTVEALGAIAKEYGRPLLERRASGVDTPPPKKKKANRKPARERSDRVSPVPEEVRDDLELTENGRIICPLCGKDYKNLGSLTAHFSQDHEMRFTVWQAKKKGEPLLHCACGEEFASEQSRTIHERRSKGKGHHAVD